MIQRKVKVVLMALAALVSVSSHAGFFLVDGKSRGASAAPSVEQDEPPVSGEKSEPATRRKMTGKFTVARCESSCVKDGGDFRALRINASIKTKDLDWMREMPKVVIMADGSLNGLKKAGSLQSLIGKRGVEIVAEGADVGYLLVREGD